MNKKIINTEDSRTQLLTRLNEKRRLKPSQNSSIKVTEKLDDELTIPDFRKTLAKA